MAIAEFIGVYSTKVISGDKAARTVGGTRKQLWFVWRNESSGNYFSQPINAAYRTTDKPRYIEKRIFDNLYVLEPKILTVPVTRFDAAQYEPHVTLESEEQSLSDVDYKSSEQSKKAKKGFSEKHIPTQAELLDIELREKFTLSLAKLNRGNKVVAVSNIEELLNTEEGIISAHKHMFTDFGIDLRKVHLYGLSIKAFERAYMLSPDDPNALFNLARIQYETEHYDKARECLKAVLKLDPLNVLAIKLQDTLRKENPDPIRL